MADFAYVNVNPDNERVSDCVTRAMVLSTGIEYPEIRKKLFHISKLLNCSKLDICCYRFLLDNVFSLQRINCHGLTVEQFADIHPVGTYLIRVPSHLTTVINGCVKDIWDCRSEPCDIAWFVK